MLPDTARYALVMLFAGMGIPLLAALNAQLGVKLGSPAAAAVILFVVAFLAALATLAVTAGPAALAAAPAQPRHLFLAGLLVAFYVLSITWIAPRFGVGNAVFFVLLGQLASAAIIDHFGLFGAVVKPLGLMRAAGIAAMAAGVMLATQS